jgi:hypothetical protein
MPSPFAVTAVSNSVSLDDKRHGEAAFTVFNASGRPIRGRARPVPESAQANAWLSLAGVAERDFPIAGTEQYTVHIAVPRDAPAGSYAFRLDMVGVENPDELFTQGPTISFEVPEAAPAKAFPWWAIIAAVAGLILCCGLTIGAYFVYQNLPKEEPTPTLRPTPTPRPTSTEEPTPEPTPQAVEVDIVADEDAFYWPFNLACVIGSCPDWGHGPELQVVNTTMDNGFAAVHFDLGGIPEGATIEEATLNLYLTDASDTSFATITVHRIISPWSEDDVASRPTYDTTGESPRGVNADTGWYDWDVTAIVQHQHANPTSNYGICLTREGAGSRTFGSYEGSAAVQPYLHIVYRP